MAVELLSYSVSCVMHSVRGMLLLLIRLRVTTRACFSCQTFEGGFGGGPGQEAHGGYTFCGFAALSLLNCQHLADTDALLVWSQSMPHITTYEVFRYFLHI